MSVTPENPGAITIRPPQLIRSLISGFNAIANHIYMILPPVILDLLLWFGPHLRLKTLMEPAMLNLVDLMRQSSSAEMRPLMDNLELIWKSFLEQFNLFSLLSTFPVGVPTLMGGVLPVKTPLGVPQMVEVNSVGQFLLGWLAFTLLGFMLGSLYFAGVARSCSRQLAAAERSSQSLSQLTGQASPEGMTGFAGFEVRPERTMPPFRPGALAWETLQVLLLVFVLIIIALAILTPTLILSTFVALISQTLAQIVLLLVSFVAIWLLLPLVFSPHGIFLCGQNVLNAMLNSTRVVRHVLPGTGFFLLVAILLNQGMNTLWTTPPASSWMALVGIFGHAFIITGLLAASFIYYRTGLTYVQALRKLSFKNS